MNKSVLILSAASLIFASAATSQTLGNQKTALQSTVCLPGQNCEGQDKTEGPGTLREDLLSVVAKEKTKLLENDIVTIKLDIQNVAPLKEQVPIEGVSAQGYSRFVIVKGKKIAQTVLNKLQKDSKSVALNPDNFVSQFEIKDGSGSVELDTKDLLDIDGNEKELIAALKKLNEEDGEEEESGGQQTDKPPNDSRNANSGSNSGNSGNQQSDNQNKETKLPTIKQDEEVTSEIRVTTEGCDLVVDAGSAMVREQSKSQTFENGILVEESACSDSGRTFPIQKSFMTCPDKVDIPARFARPQYVEYFMDANQTRQELSECQPDDNQSFAIKEKDTCPVDIDLMSGLATIHTKLTYENAGNVEIQVRGCEPSENVTPIQMVQDFSACSVKHDMGRGLSTALATWIYQYEGTFYQASPCIETETTYNHEKVFKRAGADVCPVILDMSGQVATRQYRTMINVDGREVFIDECTPENGGPMAFKATAEGCSDPETFQHDLGANVSYGLQRYYYENPEKVFVTECQPGGPIYQHSHEQTDWRHFDEQLMSQPLTTVSINVNGQPYEIAANILLDGEPQIPYDEQDIELVKDGNRKTHEGCMVYQKTLQKQNYLRPDTSVYQVLLGAGTPQELGESCVKEFTEWEHDDENLFSQKKHNLIVAYDAVRDVVLENQVLPNEPEVAYLQLDMTTNPVEGEKYHEQCNVFQRTQAFIRYGRPDNTAFETLGDAGEPEALGDFCTTTVTGWEHNDEDRYSKKRRTVTVAYDAVSEVLQNNVVLPDEPEITYKRQSETLQEVGDKYHEGCEVFRAQEVIASYKRGDDSLVTINEGQSADSNKKAKSYGDRCVFEFKYYSNQDSLKKSYNVGNYVVKYDNVSEIVISDKGNGETPYTKLNLDSRIVPGTEIYVGCDIRTSVSRKQNWRRPDGSKYVEELQGGINIKEDQCTPLMDGQEVRVLDTWNSTETVTNGCSWTKYRTTERRKALYSVGFMVNAIGEQIEPIEAKIREWTDSTRGGRIDSGYNNKEC